MGCGKCERLRCDGDLAAPVVLGLFGAPRPRLRLVSEPVEQVSDLWELVEGDRHDELVTPLVVP
jgi:hypothetical protein